jgi:hypothetical protein
VEASSGGGAPLVLGGGGGGRFGRGDGGAARGECAGTLCRARWGGEGCGRPGRRRGWWREVGEDADGWVPPVGERKREERERWAGGGCWAGKGDGSGACSDAGRKIEEWKGGGPREKGKGERV